MQSKPTSNQADPLKIRILLDSCNKEIYLRSLWSTKYEAVFKDATTLKRSPKDYFETDISKYLIEESMPALIRDYVASGNNKRILKDYEILGVNHLRYGHSIVDLGIGDASKDSRLKRSIEDLSLDPVMRPVPPRIKNILFGCDPSSRNRYL